MTESSVSKSASTHRLETMSPVTEPKQTPVIWFGGLDQLINNNNKAEYGSPQWTLKAICISLLSLALLTFFHFQKISLSLLLPWFGASNLTFPSCLHQNFYPTTMSSATVSLTNTAIPQITRRCAEAIGQFSTC